MKRKMSLGALRTTLEALLREAGEQPPTHEVGDSLDVQVDRYLNSYEAESKPVKAESLDLRSLSRRFLMFEEDASDQADAVPGVKLTSADIDIESFANSVVRLIDNYESLLEVRNTLLRRAMNFIKKSYDDDVVSSLEDALRDQHGLAIGKSKMDIEDEDFVAPRAGQAGPIGGAGGPVGTA